jgi:hypothetical protein
MTSEVGQRWENVKKGPKKRKFLIDFERFWSGFALFLIVSKRYNLAVASRRGAVAIA